MKKLIGLLIVVLLSAIGVFADESKIMPSISGIVKNVEYIDTECDGIVQTLQKVRVQIKNAEHKTELIDTDNMLTGNPYYDIKLKEGMKVILHVEENDGELIYSVEDIKRSGILAGLVLLFCGLLLYVGKKNGLCSLVAIGITCILIAKVLSPMILSGFNPVVATIMVCIASTAVTMYLVGGFNTKSTSAMIGCILSLVFAGFISFLTVKFASLTGFTGESSMFLYSAHPELNFVSIIISSIILATLGAVMDVGMSIASTINEIYTVDNTKSVKELFVSGMNVGRDIIGTMANTLILVYIGGSLPLLLLSSNIDMYKFVNLNQVVTEISSALIGSIAIVICVPLTAIVASELVVHIKNKPDFEGLKKLQ